MDNKILRNIKRQKYNIILSLIVLLIIAGIVVGIFINVNNNSDDSNENSVITTNTKKELTTTELYSNDAPFLDKLNIFASNYNLDISEWEPILIERGKENPEIHDFILNYPLKKNQELEIDLSKCANSKEVPLLIQWDDRWGYKEYNSSIIGIAGCGPTCLSMVSLYLLDDPSLTPVYLSKFAEDNNYCFKDSGTSWDLMTKGAKKLGLRVFNIPNVEKKIIDNLELGHPIICNVGPGCFTQRGHYVVIAGYENGKFIVNDPNSIERSNQLWDYEEFSDSIKNLWVYSK